MFLLWRRQQQQHQHQWRYFRPFNSINYSAIVTDIHFTILYIVIKRSATSKFGARNRSVGTNQLWRSSLLLSEAVSHLFSKQREKHRVACCLVDAKWSVSLQFGTFFNFEHSTFYTHMMILVIILLVHCFSSRRTNVTFHFIIAYETRKNTWVSVLA